MMNGKIIDGRYEIIEEIGRGGMAVVYLAKCLVLNRYVAIKTLRPEFREDEEFIKRFKIEAQSAGNLSHPNLVSIYDVGNEGDTEYIVMEYVEGITLKQYLSAKGVLPEKEAIDFASQICSGLEHAHKKGIVHKDIKPENILITKEGILKITDFGIAKALNQGTITTGSMAMGSVHYFSPEQARGSFVDAKTDIYSVGVLLYEMATGKRPFDGDSAISIAMQHIETEPVRPSIINANVSSSLEAVILKAMKKDTFERYQSATQMLIDLKKASIGSVVNHTAAKKPVTAEKPAQPAKRQAPNPETIKKAVAAKEAAERKRKRDRNAIIAGVVSAVVALGLCVWILASFFISPDDVYVPDFKGKTYSEVLSILKEKDSTKLQIKLIDEDGREISPETDGIVIGQEPRAGKSVKYNATITLTIGTDAELIIIPDLIDKDAEEAIKILKSLDLEVTQENVEDEDADENCVVKTSPSAGTEVEKGSEVKIYVNSAEDLITVPDLAGKSEKEAKSALEDAGLTLGEVKTVDSSEEKGSVVKQTPKSGSKATKDSEVDIYISSGSEEDNYTRVPSLIGKTDDAAQKALESAGLKLGDVKSVESDKPKGTVVKQSRSENDRVEKGTIINIEISKGPSDEPKPTEPVTPSNPSTSTGAPSTGNPAA